MIGLILDFIDFVFEDGGNQTSDQTKNKRIRYNPENDSPNAYWRKRSWRRTRHDVYEGYYKTLFKSPKGKAEISPSGRIDMYIYEPPSVLRHHKHWACFNVRPPRNGWYWIHCSETIPNLSSGVLTIEGILSESYKNEHN